MSSRYVRTMVRGWLGTIATPYHDTINTQQSPTDAIWVTAEFDAYSSDNIAFCRGTRQEDGVVTLIYMAQPGVGDDAVLIAAEADLATLMTKQDAAGRLVITDHSAPLDYSSGDADSTYRIAIELNYSLFSN